MFVAVTVFVVVAIVKASSVELLFYSNPILNERMILFKWKCWYQHRCLCLYLCDARICICILPLCICMVRLSDGATITRYGVFFSSFFWGFLSVYFRRLIYLYAKSYAFYFQHFQNHFQFRFAHGYIFFPSQCPLLSVLYFACLYFR